MSAGAIVTPVRADIVGFDKCMAEGCTARGSSPVLALCRKLVDAGIDPARSLSVFRGDTVCLKIRSIGEAAALTVAEGSRDTARFRPWRPMLSREGPPRIARRAGGLNRDRKRPYRAMVGSAP